MTKRSDEDNGSGVGVDPNIADIAALKFEDAMRALEDIVARLEKGTVPLEDSITLYERGERLKQHCERLLKQAEMRIEKIVLNKDGVPEARVPLDAP